MNVAVLGANWSPCAEPMDQMVVPATGLPSAPGQVKAVPPQSWTSIPRCCLYQACRDGASLALKKMPPMPVTRFMCPPMRGGGERFYSTTDLRLATLSTRPSRPTIGPSQRRAARCLRLQVLLQAGQHLFPVLFRVLARLLGGIVVLGERDFRLIALAGQLDGDGVVVLRLVGEPGERAEMAVLQRAFRLDLQQHAFVLI